MFQPDSTTTMEEDIKVDDNTLNPVQEFTYLGSIIVRGGHVEAELQERVPTCISGVSKKYSGILTICP